MKRKILYIALGILTSCLTGCTELVSTKYTGIPGINFVAGIDGNLGEFGHTHIAEYNFATMSKVWETTKDTILVKLRLEGMLSPDPLRFAFKTSPVEGFKFIQFQFAETYIFPANEYTCSVPVVIPRPEKRDSVYRMVIKFDYDKCELLRGTKERQSFTFEITDKLTLEMVRLTASAWKSKIENKFGKYTNTKLRFIVHALKQTDLMRMSIYGPQQSEIELINNTLDACNAARPADKPILDEDGSPLVFQP